MSTPHDTTGDKPNPHDALRAASFIPLVKCSQCGANVAHWVDRMRALASCNGCGALTTCKTESGYALASEAGAPAADAWGEAHELAALERLFEIGLAVLRSDGLARDFQQRGSEETGDAVISDGAHEARAEHRGVELFTS